MTLLTQEQLELRMAETGYARAKEQMAASEAVGAAERNPYAATIYRDFVQPLAALVQQAQDTKGPAGHAAHIALLRPLDPWAVAFLSVRTVLSAVMVVTGEYRATVRHLCHAIGKALHCELYLTQFDEIAPDLYFIISEDLNRRRGTNAQHRYDTFRVQAEAKGMVFMEWGKGARDQVGAWVLDQLINLGMVVMDMPRPGPGRRPPLGVWLTGDVEDTISQIKEQFALSRPFSQPCVEVPRDWTGWNEGGWHTNAMRRVLPHPVKARSTVRDKLADMQMPEVWAALNALQRTPWAINTRVLDTVEAVSRQRNVGELCLGESEDKPAPLSWFDTIGDKERSPEQEQEFAEWKAAMTAWYTKVKLQRVAKYRLTTSLRVAREYREYPAIYFVHFCDSRGRVYPQSQGVNPQGSDVQKGLLHFAEGKAVLKDGEWPEFWFLIHGANKFGFDKASLADRARWYADKVPMLLRMADDPVEYQDWLEADNPCQFLAWVFEFAEWHRNGVVHSRLPVGLDGSCSGLQHFSAMLRDEIGGRATNLVPCAEMQDIYKAVAEAARARMEQAEPDEKGFRQRWLEHGLNRSLTKRSVMTTPYGVGKRSAIRYVIDDYLRAVPTPFTPREHYPAAAYLMDFVWPAIGDVVVKSREAMQWLEKAARHIVKLDRAPDGDITWVTPSGFLASQAYYEVMEHSVATRLHGHKRIRVLADKDSPDRARHGQGMAPNFVHSMDAAHLHKVANRMAAEIPGVSLAFIHDDMGTHAADTALLFRVIREEFVSMYGSCKPLEEFAQRYDLPEPPGEGGLNLEDVLRSDFFFS